MGISRASGLSEGVVNAGTAETANGVTVIEKGSDNFHHTKLTLASTPITIGDNASLGTGVLVYTFPAGIIAITMSSFTLGVTLTTGTPTTDTPEIALGKTIGSGAIATLAAGMRDICPGDSAPTLTNLAGTQTSDILSAPSNANLIDSGDAHTLYVNLADAYADVTDTAATIDGTISIAWVLLD